MASIFIRLIYTLVICLTMGITSWAHEPVALATQPPTDPKRYVLFWLYNAGDPDGSYGRTNLQAAFDAGVNAVLLGINWNLVVAKPGATPNWATIDSYVKLATDNNVKIAFRILVSRDYDAVNGFWGDSQTMIDATGMPLHTNQQANFSLNDAPSVAQSQEFVKAVTQRYQYLQAQGKLLFISVVTSPYAEMDYPFTNNPIGGKLSVVPFDYSPVTQSAYRQWLTDRYKTIDALNKAWDRNYTQLSDIAPPQPDPSSPYNVFSGKAGDDWYVFRHQTLKAFIGQSVSTIRGVDPSIVIMNEHGSVWDNFSGLRGTYGFKDLAQLADGLKINDAPEYNHYFSTDLIRSNVAPGKWIMNEVDGQDMAVDLQTLYDQAEQCFRLGSQAVTFANFSTPANWARMKWVIQKLKSTGVLDQPVARITPTVSMSYTLSSLVHSDVHSSGLMGKYLALRASAGNQPIAINLVEDLLGETMPVTPNQPPTVAKPIPGQTAVQGQFFSLSIAAGTFADTDGTITTIAVTGLPTGLSYDPIKTTIFGTPTVVGSSQIVLTATDDKGASVANTFQLVVTAPAPVTVTPTNKPPTVANPVGSLSMVQGSYASLSIATANFADPDGKIVSFGISGIPAGLGFNQDGNTLFIYGTPLAVGTNKIVLTANDNNGASVSDTFLLYIKSAIVVPPPSTNQAPTLVTRLGSQTATQGSPFSQTIPLNNFADSDGRIVRVEASPLPAGMSYDKLTRTLSGTPTTVGITRILVTAFDDGGASVTDTLRLSVLALVVTPNSPPVVVTPLPDQTTVQGRPFQLTIPTTMFSDPIGRIATVTITGLPMGIQYSATTSLVAGTPLLLGVSSVIVKATNDRGMSVSDTFRLIVISPPANRPPTVANPIPNLYTTQGQIFSYLIADNVFADADGQIISIAVTGLPLGLTYQASTRTISGQGVLLGSSRVVATAFDDKGASVADTFQLTVRTGQQLPANQPPVVVKEFSNQVAYAGKSYSLTIPSDLFSDPDGYIAQINVSGLPSGLTYSPTSRMLSGKPILLGTSVITMTATDDRKASVSSTFLLTVRDIPANQPPIVVRQITNQTAVLNATFILPISTADFADADGQVVSVQVAGLPPGLTYANGQISGQPTALGTSTVAVTAIDDLGASVRFAFTITVTTLDASVVLFGNAGKTSRSVVDADAININSLPSVVNMYAQTASKTGSISLALLGPVTRSGSANGDVSTLYLGQNGFAPQVGRYTATVTVYAGQNKTGAVLLTKVIRFDILVTN